MTLDEKRALLACEKSNSINLAYYPGDFFRNAVKRLHAAGLLDRGATGGFWLSSAGKREFARMERAK